MQRFEVANFQTVKMFASFNIRFILYVSVKIWSKLSYLFIMYYYV